MKRWWLIPVLGFLVACSNPPEMPEVDFLSPSMARVVYQGQVFVLEKGKPAPEGFPLEYRFEDDGDLDLKIGNRWVEFDNPYDLDLKIKKSKRKKYKKYAVKKKSRRKKKR